MQFNLLHFSGDIACCCHKVQSLFFWEEKNIVKSDNYFKKLYLQIQGKKQM